MAYTKIVDVTLVDSAPAGVTVYVGGYIENIDPSWDISVNEWGYYNDAELEFDGWWTCSPLLAPGARWPFGDTFSMPARDVTVKLESWVWWGDPYNAWYLDSTYSKTVRVEVAPPPPPPPPPIEGWAVIGDSRSLVVMVEEVVPPPPPIEKWAVIGGTVTLSLDKAAVPVGWSIIGDTVTLGVMVVAVVPPPPPPPPPPEEKKFPWEVIAVAGGGALLLAAATKKPPKA